MSIVPLFGKVLIEIFLFNLREFVIKTIEKLNKLIKGGSIN